MRLKIHGFHDGHACGYYRLMIPLEVLSRQGHDVTTSYGWDDAAYDATVVVGQRVSRAEALGQWRRLRPGRRLVFETDDDVWSIDPSNYAAHLAHDASTLDAIEQAIAISHMVTVSTEPLAEVARKFHDNVVVLPNHIEPALLEMQRPRRERVTVGYAGGDSHVRDLGMVASELTRFFSRNPHVDFHTIGTDYRGVLGLPGRFTLWSADIFDYYRTIDFDIGIAPLVSSVFNESKSHIKALEYAALGIPTVASDEPPYRDFVIDGVTGYLVKSQHEWGSRLYALANDADMREEMGAAAKEVARKWTVDRGAQLWLDAYQSLL